MSDGIGGQPGSQAGGNPPRLHACPLPHQGCPPMGGLSLINPDNVVGRTRGNVPRWVRPALTDTASLGKNDSNYARKSPSADQPSALDEAVAVDSVSPCPHNPAAVAGQGPHARKGYTRVYILKRMKGPGRQIPARARNARGRRASYADTVNLNADFLKEMLRCIQPLTACRWVSSRDYIL